MSWRIFIFLLLSVPAFAQIPSPKIQIGPERITLQDALVITLTIYGSDYKIDDFPELAGFERGKRILTHGEAIVDGKKVQVHTLLKHYTPIEVGEFYIPSFEIEVNDIPVKSEPVKILVQEDAETEFEDLGIEVDEADFVVESSKSSVFVGEGVKIRLSFYVSSKNTVNWQFPDDIGDQVERLAKLLKPDNCLESRNIIRSIPEREKVIKGKKYLIYDLFEAVYYPLNTISLNIPPLSLKMKKEESGIATLKSKSRIVKVKELPPHPLRDKVPVGVFRLKESLEGLSHKQTGETFNYTLTVEGQGNMDVINFSKNISDKNLDFYESGVRKDQEGGKLAGSKTFQYKVLPKVAGEYDFGTYYTLITFNVQTEKYDTLSALRHIQVDGNTIVSKNNLIKDIYSGIESLSTDENAINLRSFLRFFANFILVFMVMVLIYIYKRK
ncbi:BatD family protein [Leadbetterella byssophila]|uniref:Aerotolerance-related exported protein n=1 Tax=Leadbetterella byssophila (strain DSM 17132 / JCM 16389 / KACC 11308 / NBRC 106382 / 4M15) TaxID=649349 RepID=E4RTX7_LEAB4|nr:BatD family protein [Leadbetterella byssophila]ADQ18685.1 hypothetical protein Lbys_3023 [Leadbetterella byssophila DSM 17132]